MNNYIVTVCMHEKQPDLYMMKVNNYNYIIKCVRYIGMARSTSQFIHSIHIYWEYNYNKYMISDATFNVSNENDW